MAAACPGHGSVMIVQAMLMEAKRRMAGITQDTHAVKLLWLSLPQADELRTISGLFAGLRAQPSDSQDLKRSQ